VQLDATRTVAIESGDSAVVRATRAALESLDAAVAAFDGGRDYDAQIGAARDALSDL
jgi:hypothetical protein